MLNVLIPGDLGARTGGYLYDRQIVDGLRALGWPVDVQALDGSFPHPTADARTHAARVLAALPDGALVVIDGLAYGAMPEEAAREAARLRLVALVHHPLAEETGLAADVAARLARSEAEALRHARRVIVTSRATRTMLAKYGVDASRVTVVEPGTARAPRAAGSGDAATHLLCVATVTPRKGHLTLVRALAALRDLSWSLTCVGSLDRDTATRDAVRTEIAAHGLDERIHLAGEADEAAMAAHYDRADVFVLATEYEGYGMAVAEAIARGLPVISTPTGAIPDILVDGSGVLVPAGDVEAWTDALRRVIGDAAYRARMANAAVLVRDRLTSWPVAALKMATALEQVS